MNASKKYGGNPNPGDPMAVHEDLKGELQIGEITLKNFIGLNEEMKEMVLQWRNHPQIRYHMFAEEEIKLQEHKHFLESLAFRDDCLYYLCFYEGLPIGVISITQISFRHRRATWGIYRQPGCVITQAGFLMAEGVLSLAFHHLHLNILRSEILATNTAALLFNRSLGFKPEGILREYCLHQDRPVDLVVMSMTAEEYRCLQP